MSSENSVVEKIEPPEARRKKNKSKKNKKAKAASNDEIVESFRIFVDSVFRDFANFICEDFFFEGSLTNAQRKYVHNKCKELGLNSKSYGKEPNRRLRIWRMHKVSSKVFDLTCNEAIDDSINNALSKYKAAAKRDSVDIVPISTMSLSSNRILNRLHRGFPVHVRPCKLNSLQKSRMDLPVWSKKNEILSMINEKQVLIITSETGSGKTTQIPQLILESMCRRNEPCKIVCTQPRRLSTIAVSERVAAERGEELGQVVGYRIKLESAVGPRTALTYCTNGILLRTLMSLKEEYLKTLTHLIIDEIHERDKYTDFLLIYIKQHLSKYPNLKVILMSATADVDLFMSYFETAEHLNVPGKLFFVQELYLEDILVKLNAYFKENNENDCSSFLNQTYDNKLGENKVELNTQENSSSALEDECEEAYSIEDMDDAIRKCIEEGSEDCFDQLMMLILSEDANVNHRVTNSECTPLIAAAIHGNEEIVRQLLNLGANISFTYEGLTAYEWAYNKCRYGVCDLIMQYTALKGNLNEQLQHKELLENYNRIMCTEAIDFSLIVKIIAFIHAHDVKGTILVFLPGFEDINNCYQKIIANPYTNPSEFEIMMLHSSMSTKAQHRVFSKIRYKQKVILSTNIAETSITISDVVYVIDTGRAKEKGYDTISGTCSLQTTWISKASVIQRAGRAGRTTDGVCFHLFSKNRYDSMLDNHVPELLKVPLYELCLQTKLLAPSDLKIAEYLVLALEPPPSLAIENAVQGLQVMGALTKNEELTNLGSHLVQFSVEPHLGKMLIYAVILKCLDPILTIVSCLSCKDPFVLPQLSARKQQALEKQKELSEETLSDHFAFLKAYNLWEKSKVSGDKLAVDEYFISPNTMQVIQDTRSQLLVQLSGAGFISSMKGFTLRDVNCNSSHWPSVKAALVVGCYPNIAFEHKNYFSTKMEKKIAFHRSSALSKLTKAEKQLSKYCVAFDEVLKIGKQCSIKCGTVVTPLTVALLCDNQYKKFDDNIVTIDDSLNFEHKYEGLQEFCDSLKEIIDRKIANPHYSITDADHVVLNALKNILSIEETGHELFIPPSEIQSTQCVPTNRHTNYSLDKNRKNIYYSKHFAAVSTTHLRKPVPSSSNSTSSNISNTEVANSTRKISQNKKRPTLHPTAQKMLLDSICKLSKPANYTSENVNTKKCGQLNSFPENCATNFTSATAIKTAEPEHTVFFVIRPETYTSFESSLKQNTWLLSSRVRNKIIYYFQQGFSVKLFFTILNTFEFQGFADLCTISSSEKKNSHIKWLSTAILPFEEILSRNCALPKLKLPLEEGQQIDYKTGQMLCNMFSKASLEE